MSTRLKYTILIFLYSLVSLSNALTLLEWGDKCSIPKLGGDSAEMTEECDAGKGLYCNGEACVCTYSQRYSIDHVSKECRRKIGKSCQYVDVQLVGQKVLDKLPFNLKCHEMASCVQLDVPARSSGVVDTEKISMCLCRPGLTATANFDACTVPPARLDVVNIPPPRRPFLKNKYEYSESDPDSY